MNNILKSLLLICLFSIGVFNPSHLSAQEDQKYEVLVILKNGSQFRGQVKSETDDVVILVVDGVGEITLQRNEIRSMRSVEIGEEDTTLEVPEGIPIDDYNANRYLLSPSGYGLRKGQAYYENIFIAFNSFTFGVTDRFTLTLGAEVFTLLLSGDNPILYISPRVNFPFDDQYETGSFSAGVIYFTLPTDDFSGIGLAQGAITFGNKNNNITLGAGFGFSSESDFDDGAFMFNVSATQRISRKLSFVTDNFILTDSGIDNATVVASAALRIHFNKGGGALNVGLFRPIDNDFDSDLIALPFLSATVPLK